MHNTYTVYALPHKLYVVPCTVLHFCVCKDVCLQITSKHLTFTPWINDEQKLVHYYYFFFLILDAVSGIPIN